VCRLSLFVSFEVVKPPRVPRPRGQTPAWANPGAFVGPFSLARVRVNASKVSNSNATELESQRAIKIAGAMYNLATAKIDFMS
jgi:hypothetical protein